MTENDVTEISTDIMHQVFSIHDFFLVIFNGLKWFSGLEKRIVETKNLLRSPRELKNFFQKIYKKKNEFFAFFKKYKNVIGWFLKSLCGVCVVNTDKNHWMTQH